MAKQTTSRPAPETDGNGLLRRAGEWAQEALDAAPVVIARGVNRVLKFFMRGSRIERTIRELQPLVDRINEIEPQIVALHDDDLRAKTDEFRQRVAAGESLDDILPEAFAVAREAADRRIGMCSVFKPQHAFDPETLADPAHRELFAQCRERLEGGARVAELRLPASFYAEIRELYPEYRPPFRMRPFDVQLIGGIVLHQGKIAEMVTGEGKTLVATLPAYLNALAGTHVHVVTVNDYLARRDCDWNAPMFECLGLTVGAIQSDMNPNERKPEYECNITYGTNNEFGFDYLRDNMKDDLDAQAQGPLQYAIIDEVDSILVDEARTPLIISGPAEESSDRYYIANRLVNTLKGVNAQRLPRDEEQRERVLASYDYTYNLKDHSTALTDRGIKNAQRFLGVDNLYHGRNMDWPPYIEAGLKAKELYKLDVDYVIREGEVVIVDEFTGRLMPGRRWSDGLHQAVEAKEAPRGARIKEENQTLATITFQNFFRLYDKIAGMTGTALTEAAEFMKIYELDVLPIPTNRPLRRSEMPDLIYGTEKEKWGAIVDDIAAVHKTGRPMLVGTITIESSEKLSRLLERRGVKHEVLNAKHHEREAGIVALAGQFGAVTVATNMAGRGTDIVLGRPTWQKVLAHWQEQGIAPRDLSVNLGRDELMTRLRRYWFDAWGLRKKDEADPSDDEIERRLEADWAERGMAPLVLADSVAELGGLHIVGTERHEARRIDNQLRGRAGRQGDPGSSRFFVSLEDDLMKIFMADWVRKFMLRAGLGDGEPIESGMVSRAIERAQRKVEEHNFEIRKNLLQYDEVMDEQRKIIYDQRQEVLEGGQRRDPADTVDRALTHYLAPELRPPSRELPERVFARLAALAHSVGVELTLEEWLAADREALTELLAAKAAEAMPDGLSPEHLAAWTKQLLDDCRADSDAYPERWRLGRIARWASRLGAECSRDELTALIRGELVDFLAAVARDQHAGSSLDDVLARWFVLGYEQDALLVARGIHWELGSFRAWLDGVGVSVELVEWSPATTTCDALLPRWLAAARTRFAGREPADVAADLAAASARLYLASPLFQRRPDAPRLAMWAGQRLDLQVEPETIEATFTGQMPPKIVGLVAERLATRFRAVPAPEAHQLWAASMAEWHLETHLRSPAHNVIGLARHLSSRLRVGLNSLELARKPAGEIPAFVLGQAAARPEAEEPGEHIEGLEDIVLTMVDNSVARLVEQAFKGRPGATPGEQSYAPLAEWAADLGLAITQSQWRASDIDGLRLHFIRAAAEAYPAERPEDLLETFVPRFMRRTVRRFLNSEAFREQPSYASLAGWAAERFPFLPRDAQVEAQIKRLAADKLKDTRTHLIEAKLQDLGAEGGDLEAAVDELVPATLDIFRSMGESDEMDLAGLAALARTAFDVSVPAHKLEEEAEGEERQAVRVLADRAKGRYSRRGLDKLVVDAVEGAFALTTSAEQFPTAWRCEHLREWLRSVGLSPIVSSDDLRDETLADIEAYFEKAAVEGQGRRPVEQVRATLVTAALQVFLETALSEEGRNYIGLASAVAKKYGIELGPFELSKHTAEDLEARLRDRVFQAYETRKAQLGTRQMLWTIRQILLQTIDMKWKDHLYNMDHLRGVIGFRGYGQKDPKVEYKREGYEMFDMMTGSIEDTVTDYLLKVEFSFGEEEARNIWRADSYIHEAAESYKQQQQAAQAPQGERPVAKPISAGKEPGRNDPCPCGKKRSDGKPVKYKNCCGRRSRSPVS